MALDPTIVEDVANSNFKAVANAVAVIANGMTAAYAQNMDAMAKLAIGNLGQMLDNQVTESPKDAVATQITAGAGLADKIESLGASIAGLESMLQSVISAGQQSSKTAGNTPPVTP